MAFIRSLPCARHFNVRDGQDRPLRAKFDCGRDVEAPSPTSKINAYIINRIIFVGRGDSRIARSISKRHLRRVILERSEESRRTNKVIPLLQILRSIYIPLEDDGSKMEEGYSAGASPRPTEFVTFS